MQLYGAPQSPFVRKARIVLEEKGLAYTIEPLVPASTRSGRCPCFATATSWSPIHR
jgi:glutathione S-transferase